MKKIRTNDFDRAKLQYQLLMCLVALVFITALFILRESLDGFYDRFGMHLNF
ncbi:MAG: hypothetical protein BWY11_00307 [Firmicutes bacterium ADurb.Bin182]|nr:MAG: hypothetical protein BWY11_00307 [Firmicutes bacterium ADurb.Bin182]